MVRRYPSGNKQFSYKDFDSENLYASVVKHETIRIFSVESSARDSIVEGSDVTNAYLYVHITDGPTIIMKQPTHSSQVLAIRGYSCQLLKSIYSLLQAGEICRHVIYVKFIQWVFKKSNQDQRLYFYELRRTT